MAEPLPPIFVLCAARSGSTLLRYILDTHPAISAPPELHLLLAARQLLWIHEHTARVPSTNPGRSPKAEPPAERVRGILTAIMDEYAARAHKPLWAEKSVSSVDCLDVLAKVFPSARLICLHRQAPDVMASCAEAGKNQRGTFGFEPFVARTPGNPVDGLADYWLDKSRRLLEAERDRNNSCLRVKYEDLVTDPGGTLATICEFLKLPLPQDLLDSVFKAPHSVGPGDSKILATTTIHSRSIGHGQRLSMNQLSADRREKIDALHAQLGYAPLEVAQ